MTEIIAPTALDILTGGAWLGGVTATPTAIQPVAPVVTGSASTLSALAVLASGGFVSGEVEIQPPATIEASTSSGTDAGTNGIGPAGPAGAQGERGDPGPAGPAGPAGNVVTHVFAFNNQSTWLVTHNLGRWPSVTTVNTANEEISGDLSYLDNNVLQVAYAFPVSGSLYLN